ncbi:hypothetical protein JCM8547_004456 [Rhodosporidiobolus lusitaniae]
MEHAQETDTPDKSFLGLRDFRKRRNLIKSWARDVSREHSGAGSETEQDDWENRGRTEQRVQDDGAPLLPLLVRRRNYDLN